EGALPIREHQATPYIQLLAQRMNSSILAGVYISDDMRSELEVYNGAVGVNPDRGTDTFLKYKRVPFGEYTPFAWVFGPIQSGMNIPNSRIMAGPSSQAPLQLDCCTLGMSICYEIAFPYLIGQRAQDTDFVVAISEDGWFGNSLGPAQHMQIARMRAIETRRYVVRATSSGITGVVDPKGKLVARLPSNTPGVLTSTIETRKGSTPFMFVAGFVQNIFDGFFLIGILATISLTLVLTRLTRH
ncbi:MAG: apolipoprotein N-acyltransferase, partial [Gammaproteobacteria bacterium]|nr:apolipoprotein N-acyltransferase [Gammaproteobacteria bacterium]